MKKDAMGKAVDIAATALMALCFLQGSAFAGEIVLDFSFRPADLSYVEAGGFTAVGLEGCTAPEERPGTPSLPAKFVNVLIPSGAEVTDVSATVTETIVRKGITVRPTQPPRSPSLPPPPFAGADPAVYAQAAKWPANSAEGVGTNRMRGYTFASVRLNPVRYGPAAKRLYLAKKIVLTVSFRLPKARPSAPSGKSTHFNSMLARLVVNPAKMDAFAPARGVVSKAGECEYLIITSAALATAFGELKDHRVSHDGFTAEVVTAETIDATYDGTKPVGGSDLQTKIRNCIKDYVANKGTLYVVLGGDNTIVPDRDCYVTCGAETESAMPTDLYYSGLDGTWDDDADGSYGEAPSEGDLAPDVIVGRIPVRTDTQASDYIDKLIDIDTNPPASAQAKRLLIAGHTLWDTYSGTDRPDDAVDDGHLGFQDHSPVNDAEMWGRRLYRDHIQAHGWQPGTLKLFFNTITSWDTGTAGDHVLNATNLSAAFNEGWYNVWLNTHGATTAWGLESGSFGSGNAAALTGTTAIIYTGACLTGAFDSAEPSLSEGFIRNPNGGAVIYIGCSRFGWGSPDTPPASNFTTGGASPYYASIFYDKVFNEGISVVGQAFAEHKAQLAAASSSNGASRWIQFGLNLQGDPAYTVACLRPLVDLAATDSAASEAGPDSGTIQFTRDYSRGDLVVRYTAGGDAQAGSDYSTLSGDVIIPDGDFSVSISIDPTEDDLDENPETVIVTLSTDAAYEVGALSEATVTIADDDPEPSVEFSATAQNVDEDAGTVTVTAKLSVVSGRDVTVPFTVGGTASNPADHDLAAGSITISEGDLTGAAGFTVQDDGLDEDDETVTLTIGTPTGATVGTVATHTVTLSNNDSPVLDPVGNKTVNEGEELAFTLTADNVVVDPPTFTMTGAPVGATLDVNTGAFSWTPGWDEGGNVHNVTFKAHDSWGQSDSEIITITIDEIDNDFDCDGTRDGLDPDDDNDGLDDSDELAGPSGYGPTNPYDDDSDDDGVSDYDEVNPPGPWGSSDPNDPDSDDDDLDDGGEEAAGTDPNDTDTDDDGHSDGDEVSAGTDPLDDTDFPTGGGGGGGGGGCATDDTGGGHPSGWLLCTALLLAALAASRRRAPGQAPR